MISFARFLGRMARRASDNLPAEYAQVAENVLLTREDLRPLEQPLFVFDLAKTGVRSIYRFGQALNSAVQYWFHWTTDVDVVKGFVPNDTTERTFWTGDGAPKYTTAALGTAGANLPSASRPMAFPPPTTAPTAVPVTGTGTGDEESEFRRSYVYTFINELGDESAPSPVATVTIIPTQHVQLSALQVAASNGTPVTGRRIYRADAGEYLFVTELDAAATTFLDNVANDDLGTPIESTDWDPIPDDAQGLCALPNGILCAFRGYDLLFCVGGVPYAWPLDPDAGYRYTVDFPIVAVVPFDQAVAALTTGVPYVFTGVDGNAMTQERTKFLQPCVSKRGALSTGGSVLYPSADGLCELGAGVAQVTTANLFAPEDWQALNPASIVAAWHDGWYIATYEIAGQRRGFMFNPGAQAWVDLPTFNATAFYRDTVTDALYCAIDDNVYRWRGATTFYPMRWRSPKVVTQLVDLPAMRVMSSNYPVTVRTYADGVLRDETSVTSSEPFTIGGLDEGGLASTWEIEIIGPGSVRRVKLATSKNEAYGG